jgi:5-methylcytosine-specific restriction endonuclease McrA
MRHCPSPECQELRREEIRKAKANKSHIDRARKHGRRYGYWNVMRVFTRDRWTCQVCGVKTPKKLRGTQDPNAPELGHIVALSDGGDHLIENCQCECRSCNSAKGARAKGQLWLAGFADTKA